MNCEQISTEDLIEIYNNLDEFIKFLESEMNKE